MRKRFANIVLIGLMSLGVSMPQLVVAQAADPVYEATLAQCSGRASSSHMLLALRKGINGEVFVSAASGALNAIALDVESLAILIEHKGLSQALHARLNSPGFTQALFDCFGKDMKRRRLFMIGLIGSEVAGRAIAVSSVAATGFISYRLLSVLHRAAPLAAKAFIGTTAVLAAYKAYRILHDHYGPRDMADQARVKEIIDSSVRGPNELVQSVETLVKSELDSLERELRRSDLSVDERARIQKRYTKISGAYSNLQQSKAARKH